METSGQLAAGDASARTNGTLICHEFTPANSFMEPARTSGRYQHRVAWFNAGCDGDHYGRGYMDRVHNPQFHFYLSRAALPPDRAAPYSRPSDCAALLARITPLLRHASAQGHPQTRSGMASGQIPAESTKAVRKSHGYRSQAEAQEGLGSD